MKTAEEILKSKLNPSIVILNNSDYTFNKVVEAMHDYASQALDLAAERATVEAKTITSGWVDTKAFVRVKKDSILNIKNELK